jgi:polyisoprenoid-binding protein YceI
MEENKMFMKKTTLALALTLAAGTAAAGWTLNNDASSLFYLTTKNAQVTEMNTFRQLSGSIGADGAANVSIDLSSVNTAVEIRDQRMQEMFFNAANFPAATIAVTIDPAVLEGMQPGARMVMEDVPAQLTLHDTTREIKAGLVVVGLENGVQVSSLKPIVVRADDFGLGGGVEALRAIAGLESVTSNAPVNFTFVFDKD